MHRFFFKDTQRENNCVRLEAEEARHAAQVLRLKKGAEIVLLDGLGGVFQAAIEDAGGSKQQPQVTARIVGRLPDNEPRTSVTLYQGLPKAGKMELILQKCTEMGVHAVQSVQFARSVREPGKHPDKELLRLRRVAQEAAKQCGRGQVPLIGQIKPLAETLDRMREHGMVLVPWEEAQDAPHIREVIGDAPPQEIAVVIGPEGGITPEEIIQMQAIGAQVVTLGPRILRTETAGMAVLAGILMLAGDL